MCLSEWQFVRVRLFPACGVGGLLVFEVVLFSSARGGWFEFNRHKGITPAIAVVAAFVWLLMFLAWLGIRRVLRRPVQFRLRTLLVLILVVALPCAWAAREIQRARQQASLVQVIEQTGGSVGYVTDSPKKRSRLYFYSDNSQVNQWKLEWLIGILGRDYLFDIEFIEFGNKVMVEQVSSLPCLSHLELGAYANNSDLRKLGKLHQLQTLDISGSQVSDAGLELLPNLAHLKVLNLSGTQISDGGLKHLSNIHTLEFVTIFNTSVTEKGATWLSETLPETFILYLQRDGIDKFNSFPELSPHPAPARSALP